MPRRIDMGLGELIAAEIERRGINQREAAQEMGVADSPLSKWLRPGSPRPSPESCAKIARFLGMTTAEVQQVAGYPMEDIAEGETPTDPEWEVMQRELRAIYDSYDRSKWADLTAFFRAGVSLSAPTLHRSRGKTLDGSRRSNPDRRSRAASAAKLLHFQGLSSAR